MTTLDADFVLCTQKKDGSEGKILCNFPIQYKITDKEVRVKRKLLLVWAIHITYKYDYAGDSTVRLCVGNTTAIRLVTITVVGRVSDKR